MKRKVNFGSQLGGPTASGPGGRQLVLARSKWKSEAHGLVTRTKERKRKDQGASISSQVTPQWSGDPPPAPPLTGSTTVDQALNAWTYQTRVFVGDVSTVPTLASAPACLRRAVHKCEGLAGPAVRKALCE